MLQIILLQPFHKVVNPLHLLRDVDALRTVGRTLVAPDAMAGLAELRHAAVIVHKECTTGASVVLILSVAGHISLVDALVIMQEDGGDVYSVSGKATRL